VDLIKSKSGKSLSCCCRIKVLVLKKSIKVLEKHKKAKPKGYKREVMDIK